MKYKISLAGIILLILVGCYLGFYLVHLVIADTSIINIMIRIQIITLAIITLAFVKIKRIKNDILPK